MEPIGKVSEGSQIAEQVLKETPRCSGSPDEHCCGEIDGDNREDGLASIKAGRT